jgi:hypothetical protein
MDLQYISISITEVIYTCHIVRNATTGNKSEGKNSNPLFSARQLITSYKNFFFFNFL